MTARDHTRNYTTLTDATRLRDCQGITALLTTLPGSRPGDGTLIETRSYKGVVPIPFIYAAEASLPQRNSLSFIHMR